MPLTVLIKETELISDYSFYVAISLEEIIGLLSNDLSLALVFTNSGNMRTL